MPPQTRTFALQFDVIDSCRWFIGLLGTVEDLVWDIPAVSKSGSGRPLLARAVDQR
jgi:hypothetical protein